MFRKALDYFFAVTFSLLLLAGILWVSGFDLDTSGTLSWSDLNDHPTNWLDTALHPDFTNNTWSVDLW